MNLDEADRKNTAFRTIMPAAPPWYHEDPNAWSSGEVARLLLVPAIATLLLVGGVYWVRLQLPSSPAGRDQASVVQVRLLPRPDPAPIPVATTSQPATASVASRADTPVDDANPTAVDDTTVNSPAQPLAPAEVSAPSTKPALAPMDAPPTSTKLKFQQALVRHVARYQRYPKAALPGRLEGSVETMFSMRRDGTLLGVWVKTSSGQPVLDKAAVDTIRRAQPLPPIPPGMPDPFSLQVFLGFDPPL